MKGDFHVRFRENVKVKFLCVTRLAARRGRQLTVQAVFSANLDNVQKKNKFCKLGTVNFKFLKNMTHWTFFKNKFRSRVSRIVLTIIIGITFFSCSPQVYVSVKKPYPPREDNEPVVIYNKEGDIPIQAEKIGTLGATWNCGKVVCDSALIFSLAKTKINRAGGNALLITKYENNINPINSSLVLGGDVLLVSDFSSPLVSEIPPPPDTSQIKVFGGLGFGSETGISLPKFGIYKFQEHKHFETYYGAEAGIWGFVAWWMSLDCLYGIKKNIFTLDTSVGLWWIPAQYEAGHYFQTTLNPKVGVKFDKLRLWFKVGPSMHLYRNDPERNINIGKIGNIYFNFEILIKM